MAEETLRRNLERAFDPGPDFPNRLLLSRTMAGVQADARSVVRDSGWQPRRAGLRIILPGSSARLVAGALILLLAATAVGVFFATHQYTMPSLKWVGCGGAYQCGSLAVPLDYSNPTGDKIDIAIIRKPATDPSRRIGALLAPGIGYLQRIASLLGTLNARFDLVGFDPRGSGRSSAVGCLSGPQRDSLVAVDTQLDDPQERQTFIRSDMAFAKACIQRSGKLLPFVDTANAARDMDMIRSALGDTKLTYLGVSYGSFLGETYAHLYPSHIRALALDGVVDPAQSATDELVQWSTALQANLQGFSDYCLSHGSCQLAPWTMPRLSSLMQQLDTSPMQVGSRMLTRSLAMDGLLWGLLDPRSWDVLDSALTAAGQGNGQLLLSLADVYQGRHADGSYANGADAGVAIQCLDLPAPSDIAAYDRLGPALAQASPLFGPTLQYGPLVCSYWPIKPRRAVGPLSANGVPPILLVGGTEDPVTPYSWAQAVNSQLAGSVLLTRTGYGHVSYDKSFCVRQAVDAYLTDLTLPPPGTVCDSDFP